MESPLKLPLSVFVPASIRRRTVALAELKGQMVSDLVSAALTEYLDREHAPEDRCLDDQKLEASVSNSGRKGR